MTRFESHKGAKHGTDMKGKMKGGKVQKTSSKKKSKQILKGSNVWREREVDDRPPEEIARTNFENRKLYKINEKGDKVKEFSKQGAVRPWLDLKFEENDRMTYYNGFYVRKDAVDGLDKLERDLELAGEDKRIIKKKMMKAIRKAKRELFKEMLYEEKLNQIKSGTYKGPVKVWNKKNQNQEEAKKSNENLSKDKEDNNVVATTTKANENASNDMDIVSHKQSKSNTIEGLDLNYDYGPVYDDDEIMENSNDASMEFNGVPYSIVDTKVDNLDNECSDSEGESNEDNEVSDKNGQVIEEVADNGDDTTAGKESDQIVTDNCEKGSVNESKHPMLYEENKLMTCVEGFWIRRVNLMKVDQLRTEKRKEVIEARVKDDDDPFLNKPEEKKFKLLMKTELHRMANQLGSFLKKHKRKKSTRQTMAASKAPLEKNEGNKAQKQRGSGGFNPRNQHTVTQGFVSKSRQQDAGKRTFGSGWAEQQQMKPVRGRDSYGNEYSKKAVTNPNKPGMVRFDGYWVSVEAGDRLRELKGKLKAEGIAGEKLAEVMKQARRREENDVKHDRKTVCFSCRESGHVVADCPLKQNTGGVGACFKCGSLEHKSSSCRVEAKEGSSFSYATCFICRQKGHISKECPKNTRGLYPDGGACTLCDSNQHLIKDCPRNVGEQQKTSVKEVTAGVLKAGELLEIMEDDQPNLQNLRLYKGPVLNKRIVF